MSATSNNRSRLITLLSLMLCLLLLVPTAEAAKKKKKKKKKKKTAETTQVEQVSAADAGPTGAAKRAFAQLRAYNTEAARVTLDGVAEDDVYAQTASGWVLEQKKQYTAAAAQLRETADRHTSNPAPVFYLGETYLHAKNMAAANDAFAQAETRARAVLEAHPDDPVGLYYLGSAQQRQHRFDEAFTTLGRARQSDPGNAMIVFQLGATRAFQEQWQSAHDLLSEAINMDGGIAYAYYYRGLSAGKMGRKDLMVNDLDRFLAMAPEAPEAENARKILSAA